MSTIVADLPTVWRLASRWYEGRLDRGYRRREPSAAADHFAQAGLTGEAAEGGIVETLNPISREMAASGEPDAVGCTQITEILNTPGVAYAGPLPAPYDHASGALWWPDEALLVVASSPLSASSPMV